MWHWFFDIVLIVLLLFFMIDTLTFLWIRRLYQMVYHLMIKHGGYLIFVDLDNFKEVNTLYGHRTGDRVLREVGKRVQMISRGRGFRYGGDEFVVLLPRGKKDNVLVLAERLRDEVEKANIGGIKVTVSCVIARKEEEVFALLSEAKQVKNIVIKGG